jgi:hypothetical protein
MSLLLALAMQVATQPGRVQDMLSPSALHAMTNACHAPRSWLRTSSDGQVRFTPGPDAKFTKVDCVLKRLRASIAPMKLGFIGNEKLTEDK